MITEINCETGEVIERELSKDEIKQRELDYQNAVSTETAAAAKAEAKAELLAKLGITEDEAKLLLS